MTRIYFILLTTFLCLVSSCNKPVPFSILNAENPWKDNYRDISKMSDYKKWGTYNVHDPACKKIGEYYYMYSTDAIFRENRQEAIEENIPIGYIQVRRSKDLVNWEFLGWAFPEIPKEAVDWVHSNTNGQGAGNIWAPYIIPYQNVFRLYYSVSAFGKKTSYIGLAESDSPEGPWTLKGCVIKTNNQSIMNAIDPSVIETPATGKWWMHYGSYFGGLFCIELNPETGLPLTDGDQGHLTARRANYKKDNLEAPEILYNPELNKYFLFGSYDPLMTTYNVRVGRSDKAEGPFFDFTEQDMRDTTDNFPILTAPYRFDNHPGWAGTGHCAALRTEDGRYFMFHQGRLSPRNAQMILHVREMFFNEDGWPVVSPERYAGTKSHKFNKTDLAGDWEIIRVFEPRHLRNLEAGQILWGEGELKSDECNISFHLSLLPGGNTEHQGKWKFSKEKQTLNLILNNETIENLIIHAGHDWENEKETILFTGLDNSGRSVWGKKIK